MSNKKMYKIKNPFQKVKSTRVIKSPTGRVVRSPFLDEIGCRSCYRAGWYVEGDEEISFRICLTKNSIKN